MLKQFKGEIIYNQEVDKHFPHLTVGQSLGFAARVRTPRNTIVRRDFKRRIGEAYDTSRYEHLRLTHMYNTKVGNDFVRGVSGGERRRVSTAEMALAGSLIAAWDNSTREVI